MYVKGPVVVVVGLEPVSDREWKKARGGRTFYPLFFKQPLKCGKSK